jgi:catechol 2,3-dioxygenase-like lactoylglutathione lyase family enzyme
MPIEFSHDHVAIRAVDYAGTIAWYRDKLDFTVDLEWPFGDMQLAYLSNGTAKIEILGGSAAEPHEAIGRRLGFLKDNNGNIIELAAPLR